MKRVLKLTARLGSAAALVILASTSIALAQTATTGTPNNTPPAAAPGTRQT